MSTFLIGNPRAPGPTPEEYLAHWPIDPRGVGVSDDTAADRERFEAILVGHVQYVRNIARKLPGLRYALLDLNAGCGGFVWSQRPGVPQLGTTLRARHVLAAAEEAGLPVAMGAIERDSLLVGLLRRRLNEDWRQGNFDVDVLEGRHEDLAASWARRRMRGLVRGLIVHDPNAEMCRETLGALAALRETRYVDFLLHVNGAIIKWHGTKRHLAVDEALELCGKRCAYVGPVQGNWQWAWLLLSDDDHISTAGGLVRTDRAEGQARLDRLRHTREELRALAPLRAGQMGLFDAG